MKLDTPVKINERFIKILDKEAERLGFSRQRLINNVLRVGFIDLQKKGYETIKNEIFKADINGITDIK